MRFIQQESPTQQITIKKMGKKYIIIGLVLIIILLAGILILRFGVGTYREKVYNECVVDVVNSIVGIVQTDGYVDITINNQTMRLVPWRQQQN